MVDFLSADEALDLSLLTTSPYHMNSDYFEGVVEGKYSVSELQKVDLMVYLVKSVNLFLSAVVVENVLLSPADKAGYVDFDLPWSR